MDYDNRSKHSAKNDSSDEKDTEIIAVSINPILSLMAIGTNSGFVVYNYEEHCKICKRSK